jgi:hypothetical protein
MSMLVRRVAGVVAVALAPMAYVVVRSQPGPPASVQFMAFSAVQISIHRRSAANRSGG